MKSAIYMGQQNIVIKDAALCFITFISLFQDRTGNNKLITKPYILINKPHL